MEAAGDDPVYPVRFILLLHVKMWFHTELHIESISAFHQKSKSYNHETTCCTVVVKYFY